MCFWARSLLAQKSGAPCWASRASISRTFWSTSKKPPQVAGAFLDVFDVIEGLGRDHEGKWFEANRVAASRREAKGISPQADRKEQGEKAS
jgi:hypothetical protein